MNEYYVALIVSSSFYCGFNIFFLHLFSFVSYIAVMESVAVHSKERISYSVFPESDTEIIGQSSLFVSFVHFEVFNYQNETCIVYIEKSTLEEKLLILLY